MFAVLFLLVVWGVVASAGLQGYEWIGLGVLSIALTWVLTAVLHLTALTRARFADVRKHVTWRMLSDADARCGHIALKSSNTPGAYGPGAGEAHLGAEVVRDARIKFGGGNGAAGDGGDGGGEEKGGGGDLNQGDINLNIDVVGEGGEGGGVCVLSFEEAAAQLRVAEASLASRFGRGNPLLARDNDGGLEGGEGGVGGGGGARAVDASYASSSLDSLYAKLHDMEEEVARAHELRLRRSVVKQLLVVGGAASRKLRREDALRKVMRDLERVLGFDITTYVTRYLSLRINVENVEYVARHMAHVTCHTSHVITYRGYSSGTISIFLHLSAPPY